MAFSGPPDSKVFPGGSPLYALGFGARHYHICPALGKPGGWTLCLGFRNQRAELNLNSDLIYIYKLRYNCLAMNFSHVNFIYNNVNDIDWLAIFSNAMFANFTIGLWGHPPLWIVITASACDMWSSVSKVFILTFIPSKISLFVLWK